MVFWVKITTLVGFLALNQPALAGIYTPPSGPKVPPPVQPPPSNPPPSNPTPPIKPPPPPPVPSTTPVCPGGKCGPPPPPPVPSTTPGCPGGKCGPPPPPVPPTTPGCPGGKCGPPPPIQPPTPAPSTPICIGGNCGPPPPIQPPNQRCIGGNCGPPPPIQPPNQRCIGGNCGPPQPLGHPSTGSVIGDPHLRSLDGATFEFMKTGTFSLVDTNSGLKVQALMTTCGDTKQSSCTVATAIAYHGSVVRFIENKGKIIVAKGSPEIGALTVHQAGNTYRVHINDDTSSYIDLNVAEWHGEGFLDTTCFLGPKTKEGNKGVLGNGDGNDQNDSKDQDQLAKEFIVQGDNLLTCTDCSKLAGEFKTIEFQKTNEWAQQGYNIMNPKELPVQTASASDNKRALRQTGDADNTPFDESKVQPLCMQTISEIPHCDKLVELKDYYINKICVKDTTLTKDLNNIDHAKLAYLRQCRRILDHMLHANATNNSSEWQQKRAELTFGDSEVCAQNCSNNGECMVSGCKCRNGFTGWGCTIKLG